MREIPVDDLVCALESIIDRFGDKVLPFADQLVGQLSETFVGYINECDKDDDEATMAAMNTLECILTVLNSCQEKPELFAGLEARLLPMLHRLLHPSGDGIEHLESVCQILAWLTFMTPAISPHLWQLFDMLCVSARVFCAVLRFAVKTLRLSLFPPLQLDFRSNAVGVLYCLFTPCSLFSSSIACALPPSSSLPPLLLP